MKKLTVIFISLFIISFLCCGSSVTYNDENSIKKLNFKVPKSYLDYASKWKSVELLQNDGKIRDSLKAVFEIMALAERDKNAPQIVKSMIFMTKYTSEIGEKEFPEILKELQSKTDKAIFPYQPLMESILAEMFGNYLSQNRYFLKNRSETQNFEESDIAAWSIGKIERKINDLYLKSLEYRENLLEIPVSLFDALIIKGTKPQNLRPTLYDFLAHRALNYFTSEKTAIIRASDYFEISSPDYFELPEKFVKIKIESTAKNNSFHALKIFQLLEKNHLSSKNMDALSDLYLKRISFLRDSSIIPGKEEVYFKSLTKGAEIFKKNPNSSLFLYEKAEFLNNEDSANPKNKWNLTAAYSICLDAIKKYPGSEGAELCKSFNSNIMAKDISLTLEPIQIPEKPVLSLLSFKNLKNLYLKIVPVTENEKKEIREGRLKTEEIVAKINKIKPLKVWSQKLPDDGDLRSHKTEIMLPALKRGNYIAVGSSSDRFIYEKEGFVWVQFDVSNIGFVYKNINKKSEFFIYDRESGHPIAGAEIEIFKSTYDYKKSKMIQEVIESGKSSGEGLFLFDWDKIKQHDYGIFTVEIKYGKDVMRTIFHNYFQSYREKNSETKFFIDRSIYRPGQKIFFKGISFKINENESLEITPNIETTVEFYNTNGEKVDSLKVKSNSFGSFSGSFAVPENVLNGQMSIRNNSGQAYFNVEEYKRPKFEARFNPVNGAFKVNQNIELKGLAFSFAGAPLINADVKYKVVRKTLATPRLYLWFHRFGEERMISSGSVKTDSSGNFVINFKALPDLSLKEELNPKFIYEIHCDVIDSGGEMQSISTTILAGYTSLNVAASLSGELFSGEKIEIGIETTNNSGEFIPAKGVLTISKIKENQRVIKPRKWTEPDRFALLEDEFKKFFPNNPYNEIFKQELMAKESPVYTTNIDTTAQKNITFDSKTFSRGRYEVLLTFKDDSGRTIKESQYFTLLDNSTQMPYSSYLTDFTKQNNLQPGETGEIVVGSSFENSYIIVEIGKNNGKNLIKK